MADPERAEPGRAVEDFLGEPTRDLSAWRWLWEGDHAFPVRSHRGVLGRVVVLAKRLLRPLVRAAQADLWDRQRAFNLVLLSHLEELHAETARLGQDLQQVRDDLMRDLRQVRGDLLRDVQNNHRRLNHLESFKREGFDDVMRHSDALYALVDQKLDRYRRRGERLWSELGALLARVESAGGEPDERRRAAADARSELGYVALEDRFRGTEAELAERVGAYLPFLEGRGEILDLGCGRGETLEVLRRRGIPARGVDRSEEMVRLCRERGLEAEVGDLFAVLEESPPGRLGGIVSLHVVEHLPGDAVERLVRLGWRALAPGGVLVVETPNPLSVVVAARNFWRDPTHRRPIHPETLALTFELAGFEPVQRLDLRPFGDAERLPGIEAAGLPPEVARLAAEVHGLRDRLDGLLFGYQDYAVVGTRPA